MKNNTWFKHPTGFIHRPAVQGLDAESFRLYIYLESVIAVKKVAHMREKEFVPFAPVRSWRVYLRKLVEVGLVEWDTEAGTIAIPEFTELNSAYFENAPKFESKKVKKRPVQLPADTAYDYDYDYVSPLWGS